ncbi:MAG: thioredoxin-disulfide reductase [Fibrobacter sp.]|jgi:thioredoxin reductase (NADPH)|nr:thioredoxin-disulfide reductase [Fibrobacter sp.]
MLESVVIIGSGPAAHTAAIYLSRANLRPLLFEGFMAGGIGAGGQLTVTNDVENFPGFPEAISGADLMERMRLQSEKYGTRIRTETITKVNLTEKPFRIYTEAGEEITARALIVATGATAKILHVKGEERLWQKGISACAVCDGALPIYRNKELAVIGGGDTAMEAAFHLTHFASKVLIIHRRDKLRASAVMQERVLTHPKVEFLWNYEVDEILGENKVEGLRLRSTETGLLKEIPIGGIFYSIGHKPNTGFLDGALELDRYDYIQVAPGTSRTSVEGVFAAGDVCDPLHQQAIVAAGSGCKAALECEDFLR